MDKCNKDLSEISSNVLLKISIISCINHLWCRGRVITAHIAILGSNPSMAHQCQSESRVATNFSGNNDWVTRLADHMTTAG